MKIQTLALSAFFTVGIAHAGDRLEGDELKEFWTNKTIVGTHHKLGAIKTYHGSDGVVHSKSNAGAERIGKWWIDESSNKKCIKWNHKNKYGCHYTENNGDGTYTLIHGKKGKKLVEIETTLEGNHLQFMRKIG